MFRTDKQISGEKRAADQGYLHNQTQPHKRATRKSTEIDLNFPRPLPIKLSDQGQRAVDAKVVGYKNTRNFYADSHLDAFGRTRLMQAIFTGDYIDFIALIMLGADLNKKSRPQAYSLRGKRDLNWTPLMMASYKGHLAMVNLLLMFGVNENHQSDFGYTAWSLAQGEHRKKIKALLFEHGADTSLCRKTNEEILGVPIAPLPPPASNPSGTLEEILGPSVKKEGLFFSTQSNRSATSSPDFSQELFEEEPRQAFSPK